MLRPAPLILVLPRSAEAATRRRSSSPTAAQQPDQWINGAKESGVMPH